MSALRAFETALGMHGSSVGTVIGPLLQRVPRRPQSISYFFLPPHRTLPLPRYEKNQHLRAADVCCRRKDICLYSSVVERQSCKLKVLGSIPSGGLYYAPMEEYSHTRRMHFLYRPHRFRKQCCRCQLAPSSFIHWRHSSNEALHMQLLIGPVA